MSSGRIKTFFALPFRGLGDRHVPAYRMADEVLRGLPYLEVLSPFSEASLDVTDLYIHHAAYDPAGLRDEFRIARKQGAHILILSSPDNQPAPILQKIAEETNRARVIHFRHLVDQIGSCVNDFIDGHFLLQAKRGRGAPQLSPQPAA